MNSKANKAKATRIVRYIAAGMFVTASAASLFVASAGAQFFEDRFPFDQRPSRGIFQPQYAPQQRTDFSHAPPPRKYEKNTGDDLSTVMVVGDSMADWLSYGLESAFSDSPEIAVARKLRAGSSLIVNDRRKSRTFDWVANAKEIFGKEQASVIVMMIGLADREPIREPKPAAPAKDAKGKPAANAAAAAKPGDNKPGETKPAETKPADAKAAEAKPPVDGEQQPATAQATETADNKSADNDDDDDTPAERTRGGTGTYDFKSEKWVEAYGKRVDEMMQTLKSKNVPVIWVGLPPVRGPRAMTDMQFLNDIYKARAEKNGVTYVDVWDAFVDENGRFTAQGPDFEGQNRRLRSGDGVYFTQAGARKLAHYVDKEIHRVLTPTGPIAIPIPVEPGTQNASTPASAPAPAPDSSVPRPLAGPVLPLNASGESASESEELAGGSGAKQTLTDVLATRVLTKGESPPIPAGRADDFAWPRRAPAPLNADPVVARTTLPMTPMVAERAGVEKVAASAGATPQRPRASRTALNQREAAQREARRSERQLQQSRSPFFFFFNR